MIPEDEEKDLDKKICKEIVFQTFFVAIESSTRFEKMLALTAILLQMFVPRCQKEII